MPQISNKRRRWCASPFRTRLAAFDLAQNSFKPLLIEPGRLSALAFPVLNRRWLDTEKPSESPLAKPHALSRRQNALRVVHG